MFLTRSIVGDEQAIDNCLVGTGVRPSALSAMAAHRHSPVTEWHHYRVQLICPHCSDMSSLSLWHAFHFRVRSTIELAVISVCVLPASLAATERDFEFICRRCRSGRRRVVCRRGLHSQQGPVRTVSLSSLFFSSLVYWLALLMVECEIAPESTCCGIVSLPGPVLGSHSERALSFFER